MPKDEKNETGTNTRQNTTPATKPQRQTPEKWRKALDVDPAVHAAALVFTGLDPEKEVSKTEFQRAIDTFLKAKPADRRKQS